MIYSQLDPQWKDNLLGYSTTSKIGGYGCTITCIAMFAGISPDVVNERMKAAGAFQDSLVIWSKIQDAIPWIQCTGRVSGYDNEVVKTAVLENGGCIVEVDFDGKISTPRDEHWVLYTGNQLMSDPWGGVQRSTNYYPLRLGYAVFKRIGEKDTYMKYKGLDLSNTDSMKAAVDVWDAVVNQKQYIKTTDAEMQCNSKLSDQATALKTAQSTAEAKESFIEQIAKKVGSADDQSDILGHIDGLLQVEDHLDTANKVISKMQTDNQAALDTLNKQITTYQGQIAALEDQVKVLKQKGEDLQAQVDNKSTQKIQISLFKKIMASLFKKG